MTFKFMTSKFVITVCMTTVHIYATVNEALIIWRHGFMDVIFMVDRLQQP